MNANELKFSAKQIEYVRELGKNHRWNICIGATQSGKTFAQIAYAIPYRATSKKGLAGLNVILGVSKETIERNLLEPCRDLWGDKLVSTIDGRNRATLFGEKFYCLGAEKVSQVAKIRGLKAKSVIIDEIVDINEEVFELVKSRMSLPYSTCDAAGNPSYPSHFVKKFIDKSIEDKVDIFYQNYLLRDNPFLDRSYTDSLEKEYAGSVYYNRYILGEWTRAEGVIYDMFDTQSMIYHQPLDPLFKLKCSKYIAVDYGTHNDTVYLRIFDDGTDIYVDEEYRWSSQKEGRQKTDSQFKEDMDSFSDAKIETIIIDPAAASFKLELQNAGYFVQDADNDVVDGIRVVSNLMGQKRLHINARCERLIEELEGYSWDSKSKGLEKPIKENDHGCDALRYFCFTALPSWRTGVSKRIEKEISNDYEEE